MLHANQPPTLRNCVKAIEALLKSSYTPAQLTSGQGLWISLSSSLLLLFVAVTAFIVELFSIRYSISQQAQELHVDNSQIDPDLSCAQPYAEQPAV